MASKLEPTVRVDVLGPLRLVVDGVPVEVRGPKGRALLALLALADSHSLTADHLVDALWPQAPPESGRAALHTHVSRLRRHLRAAAERLVTLEGAYRLVLAADESDVGLARGLLAAGRTSAGRDPAAACAPLREALALWRGPAFADLPEVAPLTTATAGFEQLRREVTDLLIQCAIDAGKANDVMGLAAVALDADPLREPAVLLLMRALAATGQAAAALHTGRTFRKRLAEETGLDPSSELAVVERGIAQGTIGPVQSDASPRAAPTLARPMGRLIGRDAQLTAVHRLLTTERLVTIVGAGGVGKTRLALEVARRADTATVLLLAPVSNAEGVPHALAAALGLREVRGNVLAACAAFLGTRPHLLVVDNCEHLLGAAADVIAAQLNWCPGLTVLATSREPLGSPAECSFRLAPLPLPSPESMRELDTRQLAAVPSVAVFLERAARVRPGFTPAPGELRLIGDLVRRLDGIPLAIELAAGRLSTFSLADLANRLDRALDLLGSGRAASEARHRTLRSTLEWSYELLDPAERLLFRYLSVFTDGVDLTTAEALAADLRLTDDPGSTLAQLVDASMIDATFDSGTRYRMLGTVRAFGLDRLTAAGEEVAAGQHLLRWAVRLTAWLDAAQTTDAEPEADAVLRHELTNLRAAWHLARRQPVLDDAVEMVLNLSEACGWRDLTEPWEWTEDLAAHPALADHPREAAVLGAAANAAYMRGAFVLADRLARAGLNQATEADGTRRCLSSLALADLSRGAHTDVVEHARAAATFADRATENLGVAALGAAYAGNLAQARELNDRMVTAAGSPTLHAFGAYVAGEIDSLAGAPERAEQHYTHAIDLARSSGATFLVGIASVGLLTIRADVGRLPDALRGYRDLIDYWHRSGNWTQQWVTLRNLARLLRRLGEDEIAALLDAAAERAPDAPANTSADPPAVADDLPIPPAMERSQLLDAAQQAIRRNLPAHGDPAAGRPR